MNKRILIFAASVPLVLLPACRDNLSEPVPGGQVKEECLDDFCIPGISNIEVTEEMSDMLLSNLDGNGCVVLTKAFPDGIGFEGVTSIRPCFNIGGPYERMQREHGLHLWFEVGFDSQVPVTKAAEDFAAIPWVSFAEPAYRISQKSVQMNDPLYSSQWHYYNHGQYGFREGIDIGLQNAWDDYGVYGSDEIIVAIIDSGVQCSHEDLAANIWVNNGEIPGNGIDDDGNGYIDDVNGFNFVAGSGEIYPVDHGTHVAGTVAAVNNNGIGVCGVAGGKYPETPGVKMMSVQIVDPRYPNNGYDVGKVFQYAAENGAVIAQNSWGYDASQHVTEMPELPKRAINYFIAAAGCGPDGKQNGPMKGGLVIFAAGNDNVDLAYPAKYEPVIAVAAVGPYGEKASYSNYGDWVDVCAPGGEQTYPNGGIYSSIPTNTYTAFQGTSMACPHVSGVAALVLCAAKAPGYTCEDLKRAVLMGVDDSIYEYNPKHQGLLGKGLSRADLALSTLNLEAPHPVYDYVVVSRSNSLVFRATVPTDDGGTAYARYFNVYYSKTPFDESSKDKVAKVQFDVRNLEEIDGKRRFVIKGLEFETIYYCAVTASDFAQNESAFSSVQSVTTGSNTPPEVRCSVEGKPEYKSWEKVNVEFEAYDNDEHDVVMVLEQSLPCLKFSYDAETLKGTLTINAMEASEGENSCVLRVSDEYGAVGRYTFRFTVLPNSAPEIVKEIEPFAVNGAGGEYRLSITDFVNDPDAEPLYVTPTVADRNVLSVSYSDGVLTFTGRSSGVTKVRLDVSDAKGESVRFEFEVLVRSGSNPLDIYPNPAVDFINIRASVQDVYSVRIYSASGALVYSADGVSLSDSSPLRVDLTNAAPGIYTLVLESETAQYRSTFTKY
ncbi:MAG: S8 family serine peptidase [Candidatus Cryptobacteroides sp.]